MHDIYDKQDNMAKSGRQRARRRAVRARRKTRPSKNYIPVLATGFDPELLYVECGRCGSPVLWEEGRATKLLREAGIDPLEIDPTCILLTDGCPACGSDNEYSVRIFRISGRGASGFAPIHGHA